VTLEIFFYLFLRWNVDDEYDHDDDDDHFEHSLIDFKKNIHITSLLI